LARDAATLAAPQAHGGSPAPDRRWPRRLTAALPALVLGGLLLLHAAVQLASRPYPRWGDAILTFGYARDFPDVPADHHSARLGVLLPARLLIDVFGFGQVAYYVYPAVMGVVLVVSTFVVARHLFGLAAAAVAGFLVVFNPVLVRTVGNTTSWHLLPDVPAAAWFTAGLALLVGAVVGWEQTDGRSARRQTARLVAAGLCFGISYTCREFTAFMFVVIPLVAYLYRLPWRRLVPVAVPMVGVLATELVVSALVWGDPLTRFRITSGHGRAIDPVSRTETLMKMPDSLMAQPRGSVSVLMLVLCVAGAVALWRRELVVCAAWLLSLVVPLLLLGGLADPSYIALRVQLTRYWVPILPAMIIGAVGTVREVVRLVTDRRGVHRWAVWRTTALVLVFLAWYPLPMLRYAYGNPNDTHWNEVRVYLEEHRDRIDTIASDYRTGHMLLMYSYEPVGGERVWPGDIYLTAELDEAGFYSRPAEVPDPEDLPEGSALMWTPNTAATRPGPADGWLLAFRAGGIRLYVPEGTDLDDLALRR